MYLILGTGPIAYSCLSNYCSPKFQVHETIPVAGFDAGDSFIHDTKRRFGEAIRHNTKIPIYVRSTAIESDANGKLSIIILSEHGEDHIRGKVWANARKIPTLHVGLTQKGGAILSGNCTGINFATNVNYLQGDIKKNITLISAFFEEEMKNLMANKPVTNLIAYKSSIQVEVPLDIG